MGLKFIAIVLFALGAVGYVSSQNVGDPGDPAYIVDYKRTCNRAVGGDDRAANVCRCMVKGMDGALRGEDEYRLAGGIVKAVGGAMSAQQLFRGDDKFTKDLLQIKFEKLSQEFQGRISLDRKQDVLQVVSRQASTCDRAYPVASKR